MTFLSWVGAIAIAVYVLTAIFWSIWAYLYFNPNKISPRPTRRKGHRHNFWPWRPLAAILERLIWPFSVARLVYNEL